MKKFLCFAIVCFMLALACAAAEPATELTVGYGSIEYVGGWLATYCKEWNDIFGDVFHADLSLDPNKVSVISPSMNGFYADLDGVILDLDSDMNVHSMRVDLSNKDYDSNATLARCIAVTLVAHYDPPKDREVMKNRFMSLMEEYTDGLEYFYHSMIIHGDNPFSTWSLIALMDEPMKSLPNMYYCRTNSGTFFSTDDLVS